MKMTFKRGRGRVSIDGRDFVGGSISINGDKVFVDGVEQDGSLVGPVSVTITGDVESLSGGMASVTVSGSCGSVNTMSGDVHCGDVRGDVSTMSGDVTCGNISGGSSTMSGDIRHR